MAEVITVNPFECRMWQGHERLEEHINEDTCKEEIESFLAHGQEIPVLARCLKGDLEHKYELIYGARRLFVARHLNVPLLAELRMISDRDAIVALDIENRLRKELSPYERGRSYSLWIRNGIYASQDELARALNVSASQISRLIRLANLPTVVVGAFASPLDICETWGRVLMERWGDPSTRDALVRTARSMANQSQKMEPGAIFRRLTCNEVLNSARRLDSTRDHDEVVKDRDGKPLFRVRRQRQDTALLLPSSSMSSYVLDEIKTKVATILHRARSQDLDLAQQLKDRSSIWPAIEFSDTAVTKQVRRK
jgi:ParB family transcriptional regulator, chromosome partitioning protein